MNVTRRGLLGMFAAGTAAAVLPSGIIMPVRKILLPTHTLHFSQQLPAAIGALWASAMHAQVLRNGSVLHLGECMFTPILMDSAKDAIPLLGLQAGDTILNVSVGGIDVLHGQAKQSVYRPG